MAEILNVLFLCTGNSARSIMAEALLNRIGGIRLRAFSAGSHPIGRVNPFAIEVLTVGGMPTTHLRSKSWDEFAGPGAPRMDFILTVCNSAAREMCPVWPGHPITVHWGIPDPAAVDGTDTERRAAFHDAATLLRRRIELLASLPLEKLDKLALQARLRELATPSSVPPPDR
jgi:arsenate reductase